LRKTFIIFAIRVDSAGSYTISPCYILHNAFSYFSIISSFSWINGTNRSYFLVNIVSNLFD